MSLCRQNASVIVNRQLETLALTGGSPNELCEGNPEFVPFRRHDDATNFAVRQAFLFAKESYILEDFVKCLTRGLVAAFQLDDYTIAENVLSEYIDIAVGAMPVRQRVFRRDKLKARF
jgi:hypothetical protein